MSHISRGEPTPRRSVRIQSGTSVTSYREGATPGRGLRSTKKQGPLPKVKPSQSQAYGSTARLLTADELLIPQTGFAQAFDNQRGTAIDRDEELRRKKQQQSQQQERDDVENGDDAVSIDPSDSESEASNRQSPTQATATTRLGAIPNLNPNAIRPQPPYEEQDEEDEEDDDDDDENVTPTPSSVGDTSKSFGVVHEGGMLHLRRREQSISLNEFNAIRRQDKLRATGASPKVPAPQRPEIRNGAPIRRIPPQAAEDGQVEDPRENPFMDFISTHKNLLRYLLAAILAIVFGIVFVNSGSTDKNPSIWNAFQSRMDYAHDMLVEWIQPPEPVEIDADVRMNPSEPGYDSFYDRLLKLERGTKNMTATINGLRVHLPPTVIVNLRKDGSVALTDEFWRAIFAKLQADQDHVWDAYFEKNRKKISQQLSGSIGKNGQVTSISRNEVINIIQDWYKDNSVKVNKKMADAFTNLSKDLTASAKKDVAKAVLDEIRIQSLALANIVANIELNLRKVNYFSPGNGANVNTKESSSTYTRSPSSMGTKLSSALFSSRRSPPMAALQTWTEPGDCWCASPDNDKLGLLQLSVSLGQPTLPTQVTIEHLPKAASLDISSAPKDVELWVPAANAEGLSDCLPGPTGYVCIGRFSYNIHGPNHVQTFMLDGEATAPVAKALVRVTSNWGSDHTCMYRVRLHGERVD
ncbi:UNC-like C-terminal-domain-containing protein [Dendryphion nanum]|uniref:UNC-like C-terminal-domain-containing protein n=1 Tax=Dendryphion nanum TaxID=256645 RepID=A0A9P9E419_9PLEO|nr:UNC-like C-terminal-domain-containing protein [Dendryphion nanum]